MRWACCSRHVIVIARCRRDTVDEVPVPPKPLTSPTPHPFDPEPNRVSPTLRPICRPLSMMSAVAGHIPRACAAQHGAQCSGGVNRRSTAECGRHGRYAGDGTCFDSQSTALAHWPRSSCAPPQVDPQRLQRQLRQPFVAERGTPRRRHTVGLEDGHHPRVMKRTRVCAQRVPVAKILISPFPKFWITCRSLYRVRRSSEIRARRKKG